MFNTYTHTHQYCSFSEEKHEQVDGHTLDQHETDDRSAHTHTYTVTHTQSNPSTHAHAHCMTILVRTLMNTIHSVAPNLKLNLILTMNVKVTLKLPFEDKIIKQIEV